MLFFPSLCGTCSFSKLCFKEMTCCYLLKPNIIHCIVCFSIQKGRSLNFCENLSKCKPLNPDLRPCIFGLCLYQNNPPLLLIFFLFIFFNFTFSGQLWTNLGQLWTNLFYICVHNLCGFVLLMPLELMKLYTIVVHALGWWRLPVCICARCWFPTPGVMKSCPFRVGASQCISANVSTNAHFVYIFFFFTFSGQLWTNLGQLWTILFYVCIHNLCGFVLLMPLELMMLYTIVVHALGWWRLPVCICARCWFPTPGVMKSCPFRVGASQCINANVSTKQPHGSLGSPGFADSWSPRCCCDAASDAPLMPALKHPRLKQFRCVLQIAVPSWHRYFLIKSQTVLGARGTGPLSIWAPCLSLCPQHSLKMKSIQPIPIPIYMYIYVVA